MRLEGGIIRRVGTLEIGKIEYANEEGRITEAGTLVMRLKSDLEKWRIFGILIVGKICGIGCRKPLSISPENRVSLFNLG